MENKKILCPTFLTYKIRYPATMLQLDGHGLIPFLMLAYWIMLVIQFTSIPNGLFGCSLEDALGM